MCLYVFVSAGEFRHIRDVSVFVFLTYDLLLFVCFFLASVISLVFVTKIGCFCLFC